jgi:hypothetical protein
MTQIHKALSHYWHLRDQGKTADEAQSHVQRRFGVTVDKGAPLVSTSTVEPVQLPAVGTRMVDYDGDRCEVIETPSFVRPRDNRFVIRYDDPKLPQVFVCASEDLIPSDDGVPFVRPVDGYGEDFCKTICSTFSDGRQGP